MKIDWDKLGSHDYPKEVVQYLKDRGIPVAVAKENNVRALTFDDMADAGWRVLSAKATGILFPQARTARILSSHPKDGKFRFSYGESPGLYVPKQPDGVTLEELRSNKEIPVLLGEGPTRSLAAVANGMHAISIPGCWNWQKKRRANPDLKKYHWSGRKVTPCFDADVEANSSVAMAFLLLGDWLTDEGARVRFLRIPRIAGAKTGLDDYLARRGRKKFEALPREKWTAESGSVEDLRLKTQRNTEGGLSDLFIMHNADNVRFVEDERIWLVYNGHRFVRQDRAAPLDLETLIKQSVASLRYDASVAGSAERRKLLSRWANRADNAEAQRRALVLARSDRRLRVAFADLDSDPYLIGTQNGVVDLRTGKRVSTSHSQMVTRSLSVSFDPDATCPQWEKFVSEAMLGDPDMTDFMQIMSAYSLYGENPHRSIIFPYGEGRNGKTVFTKTLLGLGGDYGAPVKAKLIGYGKFNDAQGAEPFKVKLRGLRMVRGSEVNRQFTVDSAELKDLTGGDPLTTRDNYAKAGEVIDFTIHAKIWIPCNHRPRLDEKDQAIWDRVIAIPFAYRVAHKDEDTELGRKLRDELPGIFNWCLAGFKRYMADKQRLILPDKVKAEIEQYRHAMDPVSDWLKQCTARDAGAKANRKDAYTSYTRWCSEQQRNGMRSMEPHSQTSFKQKLKELGYKTGKNDRLRFWKGFSLIQQPRDSV